MQKGVFLTRALEDEPVLATDFRIGPPGHLCFAIRARPAIRQRRIGHGIRHPCEIETYKAMAMLSFSGA